MGHIDGTDEVHFEYVRPVGRFEVPERKTVLARTDGHGKDDVVGASAASRYLGRRAAHGVEVGDIADDGKWLHSVLLPDVAGYLGHGGVAIEEGHVCPLGG